MNENADRTFLVKTAYHIMGSRNGTLKPDLVCRLYLGSEVPGNQLLLVTQNTSGSCTEAFVNVYDSPDISPTSKLTGWLFYLCSV